MSISILSQMLIDLESCLYDFETNEIFIIRDLPRNNNYDRYYNQCKLLLDKIQKLRNKVLDLEINNFNLSKLLEQELNEKKLLMDKTIMVSKAFGTMSDERLVLDDINRISDFLNWIIDFTNRLQISIEDTQIENIQNGNSLLRIGNVRFYLTDKELSKMSWGADMFNEYNIEEKSDLDKYGLNGKGQNALCRLYSIAKQYDKDINKNKKIIFDFLDEVSKTNYKKSRKFNMINTRKDYNKNVTTDEKKYATVMSSLRKLSKKYGWGINIPKKTEIKNKWQNSDLKKGIKYVIEIE